MNADHLLGYFERVADSPDAIGRLRRFIFDLAVRGKLVPQDASDEPASELLRRIMEEVARLAGAGKIRKSPTFEPITDAEALYALPKTWAWVRVGEIFDYDVGKKRDPKELKGSRWLLELEDIEKDTSRIVERLRVSDRDSKSTKSEFQPGDILYGKLRPYLNKVVVADEPGYSTTEIVAIRPFIRLCPEYCALAFRRPDFVAYVERLGRGTKMPRLRTPDAIVAPFPLPPLAEQRRIVAKVDELMVLCDRLEAARLSRDAARDRLTTSSLARLNVPDQETFRDDAHFVINALSALTTRADQIKKIRQTILNLAVRGKLVPQSPDDESALDLLGRIAKKKAALVKSGQIRKPKPSEPIGEDDLPIDLPKNWAWARLCEIGSLSGGMTPSMNRPDYWGGDIVWLSPKDIKSDEVTSSELKISALGLAETRLELYRPGCLFMVARSGILKRTFPVSINRVPAAANQDMKVLAPFLEGQERFLQIMFRGLTDFLLRELVKTGTTVQSLKYAEFEQLPFAIPPLAEQQRIVAKVDELMSLCDQLEASLTDVATMRRRLIDALLAEVLAPAETIAA